MAQQVSAAGVAVALGWCVLAGVAAAAWGLPIQALLVTALAVVAGAALTGRWLLRRLGGYTGDTLGAAQQVAEIVCYLGLMAALGHG
jgi:adenosylcobinamide-GDP ribazoletransferase